MISFSHAFHIKLSTLQVFFLVRLSEMLKIYRWTIRLFYRKKKNQAGMGKMQTKHPENLSDRISGCLIGVVFQMVATITFV